MTVIKPMTAKAGQLIKATDWNREVRDAVNYFIAPPCVETTSATTVTSSTGVYALIPWDTETYDTDGIHDNVTNNSRLTAQTSGTYLITCSIAFASNATGGRIIYIRKNSGGSVSGGTSVTAQEVAAAATLSTIFCVRAEIYLTVNDYVEVFCWQNSGGNLTIGNTGTNGHHFGMRWVAVS